MKSRSVVVFLGSEAGDDTCNINHFFVATAQKRKGELRGWTKESSGLRPIHFLILTGNVF